ncbi:hypothetical protein H3V16_10720 [Bartonella sp. W8099]|nr:hypothetical protein [Bartonella apis]
MKIPVFKNRAGKTKVFGIETFIWLGGLQNGEKVDKMEKTLQLGECGKGGGRSERRGENKFIKPSRVFIKAGKAYFLLKKLVGNAFPLSPSLRASNFAMVESNYRE